MTAVSGVTTSYHLIDGVAYGEKRSDGVELQYLYDENGRVYGLRKGGILYYFLFNGQGDVIGIVDEYETLQCRYAYDAWGKVLSVKDASGAAITNASQIGNLNPFRYRGYYYDVETGFYYLNSRYYDPTVKRFLNADSVMAGVGNVNGNNLFYYCFNNPINMTDATGHWAAWNYICNWVDTNIIQPVKEFFEPVGAVVDTVVDSFSCDIGAGVGLGVNASAVVEGVDVSVDLVAKVDGLSAHSGKGNFDVGANYVASAGIGMGPFEAGSSKSKFHSYMNITDKCGCDFLSDSIYQISQCPDIISTDWEENSGIGLSAGLYLGFGASASISFDYNYFVDSLIKIFEE